MEAIGAVASVLQVAQIGTQISITLYQVASSIRSAAKDVRYIAKDIALFSSVLKDLSRALELGSKANLFRRDAFDTSLKIVDECKNVFSEIEGVLKKASKNDAPLEQKIELPRLEKMLWYFRKGKVDFLRGMLESLKSTILLELAVLNYATKVSSPLTKDTVDVDELLVLKSLVLANETATHDLQELVKGKDMAEQNLGPMALGGANTHPSSSARPSIKSISQFASDGHPASEVSTHDGGEIQITMENTLDPAQLVDVPSYWTRIDRLELALQQLSLLKWKLERIEENVALTPERNAHKDMQKRGEFLLSRLRADMTKFGLESSLVERAMKTLQESGPWISDEMEAHHIMPMTESTIKHLEVAGIPWTVDHADATNLVVCRWIPDYFEDVLWEHTQDFLKKANLVNPTITSHARVIYLSHIRDGRVLGKQNYNTANAGTQTEAWELESTSVSHHPVQSFTTPQSTPHFFHAGSRPHDREKSSPIHDKNPMNSKEVSDSEILNTDLHQAMVESGSDRTEDSIDLTGERNFSQVYRADSPRGNPQGISQNYIPYSINEQEKHQHIMESNQHIMEWMSLLPESQSTKNNQQERKPIHRRRSSVAKDHGGKRRRLRSRSGLLNADHGDSSGQPREPKDADTMISSVSDSEDSNGQRNDAIIMNYASPHPQPRHQPITSNSAMQTFAEFARDAELASRRATAGSAGSDFDFALYQERRQRGVEGRERYFRQDERDHVLKTVDDLLRRWTYIDAPPAERAGTERLALMGDEELD